MQNLIKKIEKQLQILPLQIKKYSTKFSLKLDDQDRKISSLNIKINISITWGPTTESATMKKYQKQNLKQ